MPDWQNVVVAGAVMVFAVIGEVIETDWLVDSVVIQVTGEIFSAFTVNVVAEVSAAEVKVSVVPVPLPSLEVPDDVEPS